MKIKFDIQKMYTEPEIHLCHEKKSPELMQIHEMLEVFLGTEIRVHKGQEARTLVPSQIVRIYSESKKVYIRTREDLYEVRERLYTLEERLKDWGFVRISNSEIVSMGQIEKLDMSHAGTIRMYMKNGDETYVSRRFVKKIKEELM